MMTALVSFDRVFEVLDLPSLIQEKPDAVALPRTASSLEFERRVVRLPARRDVTNCGGVTAFMKIARLAEAFNLPVTSHGAHDVTVHLLAACPNRSYLEAHGFGLERYIADPLRIEDGFALAPSRPGHGIAFDWQGLDRIRA